MIELSPEDRAKIREAANQPWGLIDRRWEPIYRAGIEAGLERAAKICDQMHAREDDNCGEAAHEIRARASA